LIVSRKFGSAHQCIGGYGAICAAGFGGDRSRATASHRHHPAEATAATSDHRAKEGMVDLAETPDSRFSKLQ